MALHHVEAVRGHAARVRRRSHDARRIHARRQWGDRTLVVWPWGSAVCPAPARCLRSPPLRVIALAPLALGHRHGDSRVPGGVVMFYIESSQPLPVNNDILL